MHRTRAIADSWTGASSSGGGFAEQASVLQAPAVARAGRRDVARAEAEAVLHLHRRPSDDGFLPRLVDSVPYAGPLLIGVATSVWLYDLLLLVKLLVLG